MINHIAASPDGPAHWLVDSPNVNRIETHNDAGNLNLRVTTFDGSLILDFREFTTGDSVVVNLSPGKWKFQNSRDGISYNDVTVLDTATVQNVGFAMVPQTAKPEIWGIYTLLNPPVVTPPVPPAPPVIVPPVPVPVVVPPAPPWEAVAAKLTRRINDLEPRVTQLANRIDMVERKLKKL